MVARRRALKLCGLAIFTLPTFHGAALADGTACKYFSQLPDDCVGAALRKYDNLRSIATRDLFAKDVIKKVRYLSSYNTTGLNEGDRSGDFQRLSLVPTVSILRGLPSGARRWCMGEPASVLDVRLARRPFRQGPEF